MTENIARDPAPPEWVLLENARVITLDARNPTGQSVLIRGGRIVTVFDAPRADLGVLPGGLRRIDLHGASLLPAFTDSHIHLLAWGLSLRRANLETAKSAEEAVGLLAEFHRTREVGQGRWVVGQGWSHNQWQVPNLPTSTVLLDAAFSENPVALSSLCGHLVWVNAVALRTAGITRETPDPPGGEIARNPQTGEPTGILKETAINLVWRTLGPPSPEEQREALRRALREAHAHGIVAIHDVESVETFEVLQQAHREGWLDLRVAFFLPVSVLDDLIRAGIRSYLGDARLKVGGVKLFTDGSLGGRTAWMFEPFEGEPGNTGIPIYSPEELLGIVREANTHGLSCAIHAIGDRAVHETLRAYRAVWREMEGNPLRPFLRNRIEHFQTVNPEDLAWLREVPVGACMQPAHLFADWRAADRVLGRSRARWTYAFRSLSEAGARVAFGSDASVASVNVPQGIYAAVWRRDLKGQPAEGWYPEERIEVAEALMAYCTAPAMLMREEGERGRIRAGQRADLVVLDANPLSAGPEALRDVKVRATLFDGRWVHGDLESH